MKRLLLVWLMAAGALTGPAQLQAQQPPFYRLSPDCMIFFNQTATGASTTYDNRDVGCVNWAVTYMANGFSALTLVFQTAQDNSGVPNTFGTFGGTVVTGAASMSSITSTYSTYLGYAPWVRVNLTAVTGTGRVTGVMYGYRIGWGGGAGGGGAPSGSTVDVTQWGGTATTLGQKTMAASVPVVVASDQSAVTVQGGAATAAALAGNPVRTGISDGTNAQNAISASAATNANAAVGIPAVAKSVFNGTTWDREFACTLRTNFTLATGTDVVITVASASNITRICHLSFTTDTLATVTIQQGTGTTCGTGTATLAGPYPNVALGLFFDFGPGSALRTTTTARDICLHLSATSTIGGVVIYEQAP